ncbi:MAG TPA: Calx-beta domain-containing protein [Acidimicrobiales bacterium]|nr:Calx-beta domain-containing protein [Acidimicrobiales bacterium]
MKRPAAAFATVFAGAAVLAVWAPPAAIAACHDFQVTAKPSTVAEGGTVMVTVTRDAGLNPSSIDVSSIDETAKGGQDFPAVRRTVSFSSETSQTFPLATTDDADEEGPETFRLHLANPKGCAINPSYRIGPDARVTIEAGDPAPPTTTTAPPTSSSTTTTVPRTTSTTALPTTTSPTTPPTSTTSTFIAGLGAEPSTTTTLQAVPVPGAGSGTSDAGVIGMLIGGIVAVSAASTYVLYRRRAAEAA